MEMYKVICKAKTGPNIIQVFDNWLDAWEFSQRLKRMEICKEIVIRYGTLTIAREKPIFEVEHY